MENPYSVGESYLDSIPNTELVELLRSRDRSEIEDIARMLDEADISHKIGTDAVVFDISTIGVGSDVLNIISVPANLHETARKCLELNYSKIPLPDDHYLHEFTEEELIDILANEGDWSSYDVIHAKQLAANKNLSQEDIQKSIALGKGRDTNREQSSNSQIILKTIGFIIAAIGALSYFLSR